MKKKINKKLLVRVGAVLSCVLLVGALAIPCFADDYFSGTITDDYYTAFIDSNIPENLHDNEVLMRVINGYRNNLVSNAGTAGLFACEQLVYSSAEYHNDTTKPNYIFDNSIFLGDDSLLKYTIPVEYICLKLTYKDTYSQTNTLTYLFDNATFSFELEGNGDDNLLTIVFTASFDLIDYEIRFFNAQYNYSGGYPVEFEGAFGVRISDSLGTIMVGDLVSIEVAYTVEHYLIFGSQMAGVAALQNFLFQEDQYTYYHPLAFANGYRAGKFTAPTYEEGYEVGYTEGSNFGFALGYTQGSSDGYVEGKDEGYTEGYDVGFTDGLNSSDSQNLGRNLLGETFSAPINALKQFEIVNWTTTNGRTVSITIMTVVSALIAIGLFFLFIKMFAGG